MTNSLAIRPVNKRSEFNRFYQRYERLIRRYITSRIDKNSDMADDLLQEVFIAILPNFNQLKSQVRRVAYALGVTRNKLVDFYRSRSSTKNQNTIFLEEHSIENHLAYENKPFTSESTNLVLNNMAFKYSQLLTLKYFENYSIKEISAFMNKSEKAVESLLTRARQSFELVSKKILGHDYKDQLLT